MARQTMWFLEPKVVDKVRKEPARKLGIPSRNFYLADLGFADEVPGANAYIKIAAKGLNTFNFLELSEFTDTPPVIISSEGSTFAPSSIYEFFVVRHNMTKYYTRPKFMFLNLEYLIFSELIKTDVFPNGIVTLYFEGHNITADVDYDIFEVIFVDGETGEPVEDQWTAFQTFLGEQLPNPFENGGD